jgi:hypothetical protein
MTRNEEIEEFMVNSMQELGIEDTTEMRLAFLLGLQKAWNEDDEVLEPSVALDRTFYKLALMGMIHILRFRLLFLPLST